MVPFRYVDDVQRGASRGNELRDRTGELLTLESSSGQQNRQVLVFADHFGGGSYRLGMAGAPLIEGCVATFECRHHDRHFAGDHVLFIGEVEACARTKGRGLVFHHGRYGTTHALE